MQVTAHEYVEKKVTAWNPPFGHLGHFQCRFNKPWYFIKILWCRQHIFRKFERPKALLCHIVSLWYDFSPTDIYRTIPMSNQSDLSKSIVCRVSTLVARGCQHEVLLLYKTQSSYSLLMQLKMPFISIGKVSRFCPSAIDSNLNNERFIFQISNPVHIDY